MPTIKQIKTPDNTTYDIHGVDDTAYHTDDTELTSASSLANSDYIPIYDTSDTASKKFKISNLVTRLKTLLGLGNAAYKDIKHTYDSSNEDAISGKGVADALSTLPEPMIFKGSLGTGGTVTTLPTASSSNKGYTYKVITDGTYASQSAKVGDTFISDGTTWVLIPSGDEPSGTVTSVKINATSPIAVSSTSAITTSGTRTISHETSGATAGSYGDSGDQTPTYGGTFKVPYITVNDTGHVTGISAHTVKIPSSDNTNTTYTFAYGTNQFTVTPSDGSASTIKVTPQLKIDGITSDTTDKEINCYGECSTAAGTAAKTVSITKGTFALATGSKVIVKFTNANTANNPTLNVNSKGAKNIFHNGARITTGTNKALLAGTVEFVYDGTQFQLVGNYINTEYTAASSAPGKVASSSSTGTSTDYARADHTHGIDLATGDANGQVKIAGTNVDVKGLGSNAYTSTSYLPLAGGTVTGTLILSRTQDASGTQNNKPALIVGGTDTQGHIEIESNEIMAKSNGTTPSGLYLNSDGGVVQINSGIKFKKKTTNALYTGSGTAGSTSADTTPVCTPALWTYNTGQSLEDGDVICIKIPIAGHANGVALSVDNGTTYKPVIVGNSGASLCTTHYGNGVYLMLVYEANTSVSAYPAEGATAKSSIKGNWRVVNYRDTNTDTLVKQTEMSTANTWRSLCWASTNNATEATAQVYKSTGLSAHFQTVGVANTEGIVNLAIGNSKDKTADGNYTGRLYLYNVVGSRHTISPSASVVDISLALPNKSGTINTKYGNSCLIGNQSSTVDANMRWYRVATWEVSTKNIDVSSMIAVSNTYTNGSTANQCAGLLYVHFRQSDLGTCQHANLNFVSNKGFNTQHFKLVWKPSDDPTTTGIDGLTCALYTYIDVRYLTRRFTFLDDGYRTNTAEVATYYDNTTREVEPTTSQGWTSGVYAS